MIPWTLDIKTRERFDIATNNKLGECDTFIDFGKGELVFETPGNPFYKMIVMIHLHTHLS